MCVWEGAGAGSVCVKFVELSLLLFPDMWKYKYLVINMVIMSICLRETVVYREDIRRLLKKLPQYVIIHLTITLILKMLKNAAHLLHPLSVQIE